jgi:hypothetical protein
MVPYELYELFRKLISQVKSVYYTQYALFFQLALESPRLPTTGFEIAENLMSDGDYALKLKMHPRSIEQKDMHQRIIERISNRGVEERSKSSKITTMYYSPIRSTFCTQLYATSSDIRKCRSGC